MEKGDLDEDTVMMQALDAGAEDFLADEETFEIYTAPDDFSAVREALEKLGYEFVEAQVEMVPQNYITLEKEEDMAQMRKLLDGLEDNDDVQAVWHNWENEADYELTPFHSKARFRMKLTKNRAFQAHFFVPCIISEVHAPGNYELLRKFYLMPR